MAALCPGVQYGLSSQGNFGENKDLIFVKLTDSALRAIEEYLKNQNKFSQNPSIQFLGNEGQVSFPSEQGGADGRASFSFSVSGAQDMEGPGGSFECVRQGGQSRLESLGPLASVIRVRANDDVYAATKHRMTQAEENHKNKRARVIKPNQTDIGRKVKVKQPPGRSLPLPRKESVVPLRDSTGSGGTSHVNTSKPSYLSSTLCSSKSSVHNGLGNGLGSNHHITNTKTLNKSSTSDIMRRPIKERLIHLLALRPYKKPELYERINRDNKEKNVLTPILKQIAFMQGNTYHLHQHMWNDVNEEWPFYTEQEKQLLKRRKPQNLTPPGSSDTGSSGSGQSPTSTHPGSPPPPVMTVKRPGYTEGVDGLPTKKARISHYRKPEPKHLDSNRSREPTREPPALSLSGYFDEVDKKKCDIGYGRMSSICNSPNKVMTDDLFRGKESPLERNSPLERTSPLEKTSQFERNSPLERNSILERSSPIRRTSPVQRTSPLEKISTRNRSDEKDRRWNKNSSTTHNGNNLLRISPDSQEISSSLRDRVSPNSQSRNRSSPVSQTRERTSSPINQSRERPPSPISQSRDRLSPVSLSRDRPSSPISQTRDRLSPVSQSRNRTSPVNQSRERTSSPINQSRDRLSPVSQKRERAPPVNTREAKSEFPDYLTEYITIKSSEQRRRYKADFNADYNEYRDLHAVVERVSRRFAQLEERLKQEEESSQGYKEIRRQIVRDYKDNQRDGEYQRAKRRFQYLHDKLSHIKRLVLEYDQGNSNDKDCTRY